MKIYVAGMERHYIRLFKTNEPCYVKNGLVSYYYLQKDKSGAIIKDIINTFESVFIDSGGFTARTRGKDIDIKDYADYLKLLLKQKKEGTEIIYANLDLSATAETLKNQAYLEAEGLKPLPVFHYDEYKKGNDELFKNYIDKHDYIAIGGLAGVKHDKQGKKGYFDYIFSQTKDKIKVHGFGITNHNLLSAYPFYSVDSTNWLQPEKWNMQPYLKKGRIVMKAGRTSAPKMANLYRRLEIYFTDLWKARGIDWKH